MLESIQARIHDPLWMLARQWQLGEFQGEDAGAPVSARVRIEGARLSRFYAGGLKENAQLPGSLYDSARMPLETLVEREPVWPSGGQGQQLRLSAEAGAHFFRLLESQQLSQYKKPYLEHFGLRPPVNLAPTDTDSHTLRFLTLMVGRVPDGVLLYQAFRTTLQSNPAQLPPLPSVKAADRPKMILAAKNWLDWCESIFSVPAANASTWNPERMEYAFAVSALTASGEKVLAATEYQEGHLDWSSFNVQPGASLGASPNDFPAIKSVQTLIPAPVRYKGMPGDRFWEFEDAAVNFGAIEAEATDLSRLVLIDFALSYSNDWLVVPIELDHGALYKINSLVVTDTFGQRTLIRPYSEIDGPSSAWHLFHIGLDRYLSPERPLSTEPFLFLPPALVGSLHSKPAEEVLFLRDEMANMAWAVERIVENPLGRQLNRHEMYLEQQRREKESEQTPVPAVNTQLSYRFASRVPDHWIPLVPVQELLTEQGGSTKSTIRLQRARLLQDTGGQPSTDTPLGHLLNTGQTLRIFEEEIPRAGALVTRAYQYARWADGSTHLWVGRRKQAGKGEGWSGLRFDGVV